MCPSPAPPDVSLSPDAHEPAHLQNGHPEELHGARWTLPHWQTGAAERKPGTSGPVTGRTRTRAAALFHICASAHWGWGWRKCGLRQLLQQPPWQLLLFVPAQQPGARAHTGSHALPPACPSTRFSTASPPIPSPPPAPASPPLRFIFLTLLPASGGGRGRRAGDQRGHRLCRDALLSGRETCSCWGIRVGDAGQGTEPMPAQSARAHSGHRKDVGAWISGRHRITRGQNHRATDSWGGTGTTSGAEPNTTSRRVLHLTQQSSSVSAEGLHSGASLTQGR